MYQLRNLINRSSVPSDPSTNMNASEDFLLLLLHAHVLAAAETIQEYNPADSVTELAKRIVANYVELPDSTHSTTIDAECEDGVYRYAKELLTLCLLWHGFHDGSREADGERLVCRYWKLMLIAFKASNQRNYAKEAVNLLLQYYYMFTDRQKEQLLWSRCINTRGYAGANIPCDLHMEHLNRRLKTSMRNLGANIKPSSVERAGKCIGPVHHICEVFEDQTSNQHASNKHPYPDFGKDLSTILTVLKDENVFVPSRREHKSFNFKSGILHKLSRKELLKKVQTNIDQIYTS